MLNLTETMTHDEKTTEIERYQNEQAEEHKKIWQDYGENIALIQKEYQGRMERHNKLVFEIQQIIADIRALDKMIQKNKEVVK
jgi:hypothetical protein